MYVAGSLDWPATGIERGYEWIVQSHDYTHSTSALLPEASSSISGHRVFGTYSPVRSCPPRSRPCWERLRFLLQPKNGTNHPLSNPVLTRSHLFYQPSASPFS